jgi:hypothetical protein
MIAAGIRAWPSMALIPIPLRNQRHAAVSSRFLPRPGRPLARQDGRAPRPQDLHGRLSTMRPLFRLHSGCRSCFQTAARETLGIPRAVGQSLWFDRRTTRRDWNPSGTGRLLVILRMAGLQCPYAALMRLGAHHPRFHIQSCANWDRQKHAEAPIDLSQLPRMRSAPQRRRPSNACHRTPLTANSFKFSSLPHRKKQAWQLGRTRSAADARRAVC